MLSTKASLTALLILFSFRIQAPVALSGAPPSGDEVRFVLPTLQFIQKHKRPPIYLVPSTYMAPIQEVLTSLWGNSDITSHRLLSACFLSAGVGFLFLLFYKNLNTSLAVFIAAWCALLFTSPVARLPGYPIGLALMFGFMLMRSTFEQHLVVSISASGVLIYAFPVCGPFVLAYWLWRLDFLGLREATRSMLVLLALSAVLMSPAVYLFLSGRERLPGTSLIALLLGGTTACCGYAILVSRNMRLLARLAFVICGLICFLLVPKLLFRVFDHSKLKSEYSVLHAGADYTLRPWPEWPAQSMNLLFRTFPVSLLPGHRLDIEMYKGFSGNLLSGLSGVGIVLITVFAMKRAWRIVPLSDGIFVHLAAMSIMLILLMPSWRLVGDYSSRYILPYVPGYLLCISSCLQRSFCRPLR